MGLAVLLGEPQFQFADRKHGMPKSMSRAKNSVLPNTFAPLADWKQKVCGMTPNGAQGASIHCVSARFITSVL
jgi:hypothetical protein